MIQEDNQNSKATAGEGNLNESQNSYDNVHHFISKEDSGRIWVGVEEKIINYNQKKQRQRTFLRIASVVALVGVVSFLIYNTSRNLELKDESYSAAIIPGSDKAILTLEDGRQVDLSANNNEYLKDAGVSYVKTSDGKIVYKINGESNTSKSGFNVITTPRGGQYRIILPDDSEVLLNASSSLRFAKNIADQSIRSVELKGEGFFIVSKSAIKPFIVNTQAQHIRVLGTVFNVNSYDDNKVLTTLIEGSVQLNNVSKLKPGQQGVSTSITQEPIISKVDVTDYIDWVNNQFIFRDENIKDIMTRLSRWYDFDVVYLPSVDERVTFNGELSRYANVEDVLKLLSKTSNLKFEIKNKSIIVK